MLTCPLFSLQACLQCLEVQLHWNNALQGQCTLLFCASGSILPPLSLLVRNHSASSKLLPWCEVYLKQRFGPKGFDLLWGMPDQAYCLSLSSAIICWLVCVSRFLIFLSNLCLLISSRVAFWLMTSKCACMVSFYCYDSCIWLVLVIVFFLP